MDILDYIYDIDKPNSLLSVADQVSNVLVFDFEGTQNYEYNNRGNLISRDNLVDIIWNFNDKIRSLNPTGDLPLEYSYNATGDRVLSSKLDLTNNKVHTIYSRDTSDNMIAIYDFARSKISGDYDTNKRIEAHLYGSSRVGINKESIDLVNIPQSPVEINRIKRIRNSKQYELSNHLGNVYATILDSKDILEDNSIIEYKPIYTSKQDYYPFGQQISGLTESSSKHRFGFNGKEKDENGEWGETTTYDYGFRIYNPSIAKFLSVDPLSPDYPMLTPYQFAASRPIVAIDLDGLKAEDSNPEMKSSSYANKDDAPEFNAPEHSYCYPYSYDIVQKYGKEKKPQDGYGDIENHRFVLMTMNSKENFDKLKYIYSVDPGLVQNNLFANYEVFQNPNDPNRSLQQGEGMLIDIFGPFNGIVVFDEVVVTSNYFQITASVVDVRLGYLPFWYSHPDAGSITFTGTYENNKTIFTIENTTTLGNWPIYFANRMTRAPRMAQEAQWEIVLGNVEKLLDPESTILKRHSFSFGNSGIQSINLK